MRSFRLAIPLLLLFASLAHAEAPVDLDATLRPILEKHKTPCLIGAIVDGDRVTALGAVGFRKAGAPERVTRNDLIHLGSDTKAMTALLIAQLIQKKQLSFESPMDQIFPDLAPRMNRTMAKVTVRQLLDHTGGLPANAADWSAYDRTKKPLPEQRRALVRDMLDAEPAYPPGTKFLYSNVGFVILGAIIEQKSGLAWEQVIRKEIFQPLKMQSAGFGIPGPIGKIEEPWGHTLDDGVLKPIQADNPAIMGPAGRVHCTITDWGKFVSQFLRAHPGEPALLPAELQRELITPPPLPDGSDYAGGWGITNRPWAGEGKATVLTHSGSNTMWYCVAWLAPKRNFAVLAATNLGGADASAACDEVSAALIGIHEAHH